MNEKPIYDPVQAGQRVAAVRAAAKLSLREVAASAGVSAGYLSSFEKGQMPKARRITLEAVAEALGFPTWDALMASDELVPPATPAAAKETSDGELMLALKLVEAVRELLARKMNHKAKPEAVAAPRLSAPMYAASMA